MLAQATGLFEQLQSWRRDFHMHPELAFNEQRTSGIVADELHKMGIEVERQSGKTWVVGHIGEGSPVIGIRADMDALPIQEENEVPYCSQNPGLMHACGHDSHTAMLLGVARLLSEKADRPEGEVRLLFQPAEENWDAHGKSGATHMIEDGVLDGLDAVIALHVDSVQPSGTIDIADGYDSAAVDSFEATLIGTGAHGAFPHTGVDPIFILAQVINVIFGIRARRIDPTQAAVISIGAVHGGTATNIIPTEVTLKGTIRSFDDDTRHDLWGELRDALEVSRALGGNFELTITKGYPALFNDPEIVALCREVSDELLGKDALIEHTPNMGAEDFSYMAQIAPGAMFNLGAKLDDVDRQHHTPNFDIDEAAMPKGTAMLAEMAVRLLKRYGV